MEFNDVDTFVKRSLELDGSLIKLIKNPTDEMYLIAYDQCRELDIIPEHLITEKICLDAMNDENNFKYIPEHFKTDNLYLTGLSSNTYIFKYMPEYLKTEDICKNILTRNGSMLKYVPEKIKTIDLCITAITCDTRSIKYISENLKTEEYYLKFIHMNGYIFQYIPIEFQTRNICQYIIGYSHELMKYIVPKENDKTFYEEMAYYALCQNVNNLKFLEYQTEEICLHAINSGKYLNTLIFSDYIKNLTENICITLLKQDNDFLYSIKKRIKITFKIYKIVFLNNRLNKKHYEEMIQELTKDEIKTLFQLAIEEKKYYLCFNYIPPTEILLELNIVINKKCDECVICHENKQFYVNYLCGHEICLDCGKKYSLCYYRCSRNTILTSVNGSTTIKDDVSPLIPIGSIDFSAIYNSN